eukprot:1137446-Pelagomonas_calceolata.AAC.4
MAILAAVCRMVMMRHKQGAFEQGSHQGLSFDQRINRFYVNSNQVCKGFQGNLEFVTVRPWPAAACAIDKVRVMPT